MGISTDLTKLEEMKYSLSCYEIGHRTLIINRIRDALIFLIILLENKVLKHKCLMSAKTCGYVAEIEIPNCSHTSLVPIETDFERQILNLLENFSRSIKEGSLMFDAFPNKQGSDLYENLIYLDKKVQNEELDLCKDYPKVERHLKRKKLPEETNGQEETEKEPEKQLNSQEILDCVGDFHQMLAKKFKSIFKDSGNIKCELDDFDFGKIESKPIKIKAENGHHEKPDIKKFRFDYELSIDKLVENKVDETEDVFKVSDYFGKGLRIYEVEMQMFFFLAERKHRYSFDEFKELNCNKEGIFEDTDEIKYGQKVLNYLIFRPIPQLSRNSRLSQTHMYQTNSLLEFIHQNYRINDDFTYTRTDKLNETMNGDTNESANDSQHFSSSETPKKVATPRPKSQKRKSEDEPSFTSTPKAKITKPGPRKLTAAEVLANIEQKEAKKQPPKKSEKVRKPGPLRKTKPGPLGKTQKLVEEPLKASDEIVSIFNSLETQLRKYTSDLHMDISQLKSDKSNIIIDFMERYKRKSYESQIPIHVKNLRNKQYKETEVGNLVLLCDSVGRLEILHKIEDTLVYDENNEPQIATTIFTEISGKLKIYNTTSTIKNLIIPININGVKFKLNCGLFNRKSLYVKSNEIIAVTSTPVTSTSVSPRLSPIPVQIPLENINLEKMNNDFKTEIAVQVEIEETKKQIDFEDEIKEIKTEIDFEDEINAISPIEKTIIIRKELIDPTSPPNDGNSSTTESQNEYISCDNNESVGTIKKIVDEDVVEILAEDVDALENSEIIPDEIIIIDDSDAAPIDESANSSMSFTEYFSNHVIGENTAKNLKVIMVDVMSDRKLNKAVLEQNEAKLPEDNQLLQGNNIFEIFDEFNLEEFVGTKRIKKCLLPELEK